MKINTCDNIFNHPWETVTQAVWRKYPNPINPAVVGTDVLDRRVVQGVLHTHRLISSRWGLPIWAQKILGADRICYGYEQSKVDPTERTMEMQTKNVTFASTVSMDERLVYSPDPSNEDQTVLRSETIITVHGVPLTDYMESFLINSVSRNSFKGRDALEWIIGKINTNVEELVTTAKNTSSEVITTTRRSITEITDSASRSVDDLSICAKKSVDGISDVAKKSIDDISYVTKKGINEIQSIATPASAKLPRIS
ncbi:unnamed protein product, partial [Meganyctiphanes norvegica]